MTKKLTTKQQRFVDFYDGNATDAARKAGFKNPERSGKDMTRNKRVMAKVRSREKLRTKPYIATREQRQTAWTATALFDIRKLFDENGKIVDIKDLDNLSAQTIQGIKITDKYIMGKDEQKLLNRTIEYKLPDRLKAWELLGRSEADFTDKHLVEGKNIQVTIKQYGYKSDTAK